KLVERRFASGRLLGSGKRRRRGCLARSALCRKARDQWPKAAPPHHRLEPIADILLARVEEGREGTADVTQPNRRPILEPDDDAVRAQIHRRVADAARPSPPVMSAKEADHVVLVDAVARDADAPDEAVAAVDGDRPGEDL